MAPPLSVVQERNFVSSACNNVALKGTRDGGWKTTIAVLTILAAAVLLTTAWNLSAAEGLWDFVLRVPYRVDSQLTEYPRERSSANTEFFLTSFVSHGKEIALSHTIPGD
jgi:hypothetical protein